MDKKQNAKRLLQNDIKRNEDDVAQTQIKIEEAQRENMRLLEEIQNLQAI